MNQLLIAEMANDQKRETAPPPEKTESHSNRQEKHITSQADGKVIDLSSLDAETVPDYFFPASEKFLVRNPAGRWLALSAASYRRILAKRGFSIRRKNGESMSEADHIILQTQLENDVSRYGPLCGRDSGFYEENGIRHLVTENMQLMEPVKGNAPVIRAIINGLFCQSEHPDIGRAQLNTFCGWMQSSVRALRAGRNQQQQAIAIAGPRDCGKSFLQHHVITPCLAGRAVNAERYFLRGNDFNGDLFNAEHLTLDDCAASTRIGERLAFGQRIKGATVGESVGALHAKGRDAVSIRPWWRISITCNDDPEALIVLPPLNTDVEDKLILLRASRFTMPMPTDTQEDRQALAAAIRSEIPAFLFFLLYRFEIEEPFRDPRRYGIQTYHHPELREALDGLSPEAELLDLIDATLADDFRSGPAWVSAEELETRIRAQHHVRATQIFTYRQACGKYLHRLSVKHPQRIAKGRTGTGNGWWIHPKPSFVEGMEGNSKSNTRKGDI